MNINKNGINIYILKKKLKMNWDNNNHIITEIIFLNNLLYKNFLLKELIPLVNYNSGIFLSSGLSKNEKSNTKEIFQVIPGNLGIKTDSNFSDSSSLFKNIKFNLFSDKNEGNYIGTKRARIRRPRRDNKDNIRRKIKRGFFNNVLINKLNDKLKSIGSIKYFMKFPQHFVGDINIRRNKEILNMTLLELFEKNEIYANENEEGLFKYKHNLKVVQSEEIMENKEFKKILDQPLSELYAEYINSDEFNINEINRLKIKKMGDYYINRYKYLAKNLIEYFSQ